MFNFGFVIFPNLFLQVADLVKILQVQWKEEDAASPERIQCTTISDLIRGQLRECLHHAAGLSYGVCGLFPRPLIPALPLSADVSSWLSARHDMKQAMAAVGVRSPKFFRHLGPFGVNETEQKRNFHEAWRAFSPDHAHAPIPLFARQKIGPLHIIGDLSTDDYCFSISVQTFFFSFFTPFFISCSFSINFDGSMCLLLQICSFYTGR